MGGVGNRTLLLSHDVTEFRNLPAAEEGKIA